jgi:hypothetical protein
MIHELLASTLSYLMLAPCDIPILQISLHGQHLCQVWSSSASLLITGSSYYPITNWCIRDLRWICPNHLKRFCTSFSSTGATPSLSHMSSFWTRSLLVWSQIHRNMRISATLSCWIYRLLIGQHSAPYNMTDQITVLWNFSLIWLVGSPLNRSFSLVAP